MATLQPPPPLMAGVRPESVQPGGGFCMNLELAWGRLRRAWLRRVRPGYVQQMLARRQGSCSNCPHDIIDPRDLKFTRNVCGYWFRPEDDKFRWRDRLGFARAGLAELMIFSLDFGLLTLVCALAGLWLHSAFWAGLAVVLPLWVFVISFFRDPERAIPADPLLVVSPADGLVTHVEEVEEPDFPGGRALRISIFLSVFNVHVNRSPRAARVREVRYFPGEFLDARTAGCDKRNEQLWVDLEDETTGQPMRVKQISGAIARRIVCWLKSGDTLSKGERFGMIKFGSRTDLLLPAMLPVEVLVQVGDTVHGGSSVLLKLQDLGSRLASRAP